jgi:hypothetical protein
MEQKIAERLTNALADLRFNEHNFAWQMANQSVAIQFKFWETIWAWIEQMADLFENNADLRQHREVAQLCSEIRSYVLGDYQDDEQGVLF